MTLLWTVTWLAWASPADDALTDKVHSLQERVAASRGLPFKTEVTVRAYDEEALRARMRASMQEALTEEIRIGETATLVLFGLVDEGFDVAAQLEDTLSSQVAGFYDPETEELVLVDRATALPGMAVDMVAEHELVHALQDQHFDLEALTAGKLDADVQSAVHALVEGDATYLMMWAQMDRMGADLDQADLGAMLKVFGPAMLSQEPGLKDAPDYLVKGLTSRYLDGMVFVQAIKRHEPWTSVDALFAAPPLSSEQILHPEQYGVDWPQRITLPRRAMSGRWTELNQDTVGELGIRILLQHHLGEDADRAAWEGWDGDRFTVLERGDERVLAWLTVWDTEADAEEFAAALALAGPKLRADGRLATATRGALVAVTIGLDDATAAGVTRTLLDKSKRVEVRTLEAARR